MTTPALCTCGVQAIGRCEQCGNAFCLSHQGFQDVGPGKLTNRCNTCNPRYVSENLAEPVPTGDPMSSLRYQIGGPEHLEYLRQRAQEADAPAEPPKKSRWSRKSR